MGESSYRFSKLTLLFMLLGMILAACGPSTTPTATSGTTRTSTPSTQATKTSGTGAASPTAQQATPTSQQTTQTTPTAAASPGAGGGKILRVQEPTFPALLDPQQGAFPGELAVMTMIYEGLTRLDKDLKTVEGAAEKWEYSKDGSVLTFTMRANLKYSDGSPLTAKNYEYSLKRLSDPRVAGYYQSIVFDIVGAQELSSTPATDTVRLQQAMASYGAKAVDDKTLVIQLKRPLPYFHTIMSLWVTYPVKQELVEKGGDGWWNDPKNLVGNGPFMVTKIAQDQQIVLAANPNYWAGKPKLDGIEYLYIKDSAVALEAYRSNQVHIMKPDASQLSAIKSDAALSKELLTYPQAGTYFITFNLRSEPFTDKKVREAFAYAFDRETYCEAIRSGDCSPTLSWIPKGVSGAYEETRFAFDAEKAKQALAESSYKTADKLPRIKFTFDSDDPANRARAEWLASQYNTILGVTIELDAVDGKTLSGLYSNPETYPQMFIIPWYQDYPDPQNWLSVYWTCDSTFAQLFAYCNKEFDALTQQADKEFDPVKRQQLYIDAGKLLVGDAPGVFLYNPRALFLVKPSVSGYTQNPTDFSWPGQWSSKLTMDVAP